MGNPKGVKRDFAALEERRMKAAKLFKKGLSKAEVARRLCISNQSAGRWHRDWLRGGSTALKHPGRAGRKSRLSPMERLQLAARLQSGAQKTLGCAADRWTLPRVAELIRKDFGHCYSASQASRLLRAMGWICQKPAGKGEPSSLSMKAVCAGDPTWCAPGRREARRPCCATPGAGNA